MIDLKISPFHIGRKHPLARCVFFRGFVTNKVIHQCLYCGGDSALLINGTPICSACDDDFGTEVREIFIHLVPANDDAAVPSHPPVRAAG